MGEVSVINNVAERRIHVRDGMSQQRRALAALQQGYFNIDEMTFPQLLTQMQEFGKLMTLPGVDITDNDLPSNLFARDEIVIMAKILTLDLVEFDTTFHRRIAQTVGNTQWVLTDFLPDTPLGLIYALNNWLTLLRQPQSNAGEKLYALIESVVVGLRQELMGFIDNTPVEIQNSTIFTQHFIGLIYSTQHSIVGEFQRDNQMLDIEALHASLLKGIDIIQKNCRHFLSESLISQNHNPALAMRVIFVKLYQKLQNRLNQFTPDFLDFYFLNVLKATPRALVADRVFLVLQPAPHTQEIELPKGTEFLAGVDDASQDIIYTSDKFTVINDAKVTRLNSLFFPKTVIHGAKKLRLADCCKLDNIRTWIGVDKKISEKKDRENYPARPLFGALRDEKELVSAVSGRLGFAIANKIFFMAEGKRSVNIIIQYQEDSLSDWSALENILADLPDSRYTGNDGNAKFFAYFTNMFELGLTTETGWYTVREYKPAYIGTDKTLAENSLRLSFFLPEDAPAITHYDAQVHGDAYQASTPVLRFLLKENHLQYAYDILKHLVIRDIRIQVQVEGCQNLQLHNNIGQLSTLSPFAPFGPLPEIGSYFVVGCDEVANKQLTDLSVDIEWKGLPSGSGFNHWYNGYTYAKNNHSFVVSATVLADGRWHPDVTPAEHYQRLFSTKTKNGQDVLLANKRLSCISAIPFHKVKHVKSEKSRIGNSLLSKSGLFKFTLQGPAGAFGQREYSALLTNTLTYNARVRLERLARPLPNPPYTPEVANIQLNYSAVAIMNLTDSESLMRDQFFHLHPMGWESISPLRHSKIFQVPAYEDEGNFYIGLEGNDFQQINLLFHLYNNSLPTHEGHDHFTSIDNDDSQENEKVEPLSQRQMYQHQIRWSYLSNNQWKIIPVKDITADSTHNFMRSGIVSIQIPEVINKNNTLLPAGFCWLRVSANAHLKNFSYIYSVYAQALTASWKVGMHPPSSQPMFLAEGTIKRARQTIPGLAEVMQVGNSFGGKQAESIAQLRTRISERLRHKNRAINALDYEMLILERFPQIYKVKCFANIRTDKLPTICPGHLLIVPVPHIRDENVNNFTPHFDGHLIQAIYDFVKSLAPVQTHISVENPIYEQIQVRCAVYFKNDHSAGVYHNLLNRALCNYISPWSADGNQVHFGWSISEQEIKSFIYNLDYVEHVTDFSLLRIAPQADGLFNLDDTANRSATNLIAGKIFPTYLWTVAVPIQHHYIETLGDSLSISAKITGYDELEVGSTFIIASRDDTNLVN